MSICATTTSVPRWSTTPPVPDPRGTSFALVTVGAPSAPVGTAWAAELQARGAPLWRLHTDAWTDADQEQLVAQLRTATVGWRLLVSGPEADVALVRSTALAHGAIPAEVTIHCSHDDIRRVHCTHCGEVTVADEPVGGTTACGGCGRRLAVYHHFSRRLAAYMGFQVDAEAPEGR